MDILPQYRLYRKARPGTVELQSGKEQPQSDGV